MKMRVVFLRYFFLLCLLFSSVLLAEEFESIISVAIQKLNQKQYQAAIQELEPLFTEHWEQINNKGKHLATTFMMLALSGNEQGEKASEYGERLFQSAPECFVSFQNLSQYQDGLTSLRESLKVLSLRTGPNKGVIYLHNTSTKPLQLLMKGSSFDATYQYEINQSTGEESIGGVSPAFFILQDQLVLKEKTGMILSALNAELFSFKKVPTQDFISLLASEITKHHPHFTPVIGEYKQNLSRLILTFPMVQWGTQVFYDAILIQQLAPYIPPKAPITSVKIPLVSLSPEEKQAISKWIQFLGSNDPAIQNEAIEELIALGSKGIPDLLQALKEKKENVKYPVARILIALGRTNKNISLALITALQEKDSYTRYYAAYALGHIKPVHASVIPALIKTLKESNLNVRSSVARAFGNIGEPSFLAVPALIEALNTKDEFLKSEVIKTFGLIGPKAAPAIPQLLAALEDKSKFVRSSAAKSVGLMGSQGSLCVPLLIKMLNDPYEYARYSAAHALGEIGPSAVAAIPALKETLQSEDFGLRLAAERALEKINVPEKETPQPPITQQKIENPISATKTVIPVEPPSQTESSFQAYSYRLMWSAETGSWNHGVAVAPWGDIISLSSIEMRVFARDSGRLLKRIMLPSFENVLEHGFGFVDFQTAILVGEKGIFEFYFPEGGFQEIIKFKRKPIAVAIQKNFVAVSFKTGRVKIYQTPKWNLYEQFYTPGYATALALSEDSQKLALALNEGRLMVRNLKNKESVILTEEGSGDPQVVAFSPDGKQVFCNITNFRAELWNLLGNKLYQRFETGSWLTKAYFLSQDLIVATGSDGLILYSRKRVLPSQLLASGTGLAISQDRSLFCSGDSHGKLVCYSAVPLPQSTFHTLVPRPKNKSYPAKLPHPKKEINEFEEFNKTFNKE